VLCDVALDPYTSHGHDGLLLGDYVTNDETLEVLMQQALVQVEAGCDIIRAVDMTWMGASAAIPRGAGKRRQKNTLSQAYAAKYASASTARSATRWARPKR